MTIRNSHTYDNLTLLKDAGAVTASGAAQVASVARVLDMGDAAFDATCVVDPSALDLASADETYRVAVQGSLSPSFAGTPVELGSVAIASMNRHEFGVMNQIGGIKYRYVRAFLTVGGTTPSINCTIYLAKK